MLKNSIDREAIERKARREYSHKVWKNRQTAYQQGLEDAWEAAKNIILNSGLSLHKLMQIFNTSNFDKIMEENTASEAIAKIKEYEEQQKQDAEQEQDTIKVGDEVYSDAYHDKVIVTHITDDGNYVAITSSGKTLIKEGLHGLHKTGRTFPQIAEVLEKMRGESE